MQRDGGEGGGGVGPDTPGSFFLCWTFLGKKVESRVLDGENTPKNSSCVTFLACQLLSEQVHLKALIFFMDQVGS